MLKNLLLCLIIFILWNSPELRSLSANALRKTAGWIEPKDSQQTNPKYFQIPNPFYRKQKKNRAY